MSDSITSKVITTLNHKISKTATLAKELELVEDINRDFVRKSKLGLENTIRFIIGNNSTTLNNELERFYDDKYDNLVSSSALVQSRDKIKTELFENIFKLNIPLWRSHLIR